MELIFNKFSYKSCWNSQALSMPKCTGGRAQGGIGWELWFSPK
jgi:hypothetical protein